MEIKQSVKNTMDRVGIDYVSLEKLTAKVEVYNRFSGASCEASQLVSRCIAKIYAISNAYELGDNSINVSDFDRLRYFVLAADKDAYYTCID